MRILFYQGTPVPLHQVLSGHTVTTAFEMGWSDLGNGDLLRVAEGQFDVFITTDQNLRYQQNLTVRQLAILVYRDHAPRHFHATYGEFGITVDIQTGMIEGQFPKRALSHVLEWYELYKQELLEDWKLAEQRKPLKKIPPLE